MSPLKPPQSLPITDAFETPEQYVEELLGFIGKSEMLATLCAGSHVLEFFIKEPDLYTNIIPATWQGYFADKDIMNVIDILIRTPLSSDEIHPDLRNAPPDLLSYIKNVRKLCIDRSFRSHKEPQITRKVSQGMNVKKLHEVGHFASFVDRLVKNVSNADPENAITHIIDLGSGQGYLPRVLACEPYEHALIGIESRKHNIDGSKQWDIYAKLAPKKSKEPYDGMTSKAERPVGKQKAQPVDVDPRGGRGFFHVMEPIDETLSIPPEEEEVHLSTMGRGSIQYISHHLRDGNLERIMRQIVDPSNLAKSITQGGSAIDSSQFIRALPGTVRAMIISLHSCGNLVHHGLRSLMLTKEVKAVALVGCCYNLLTERSGATTSKIVGIRDADARVTYPSQMNDPHGFPMSERFCNYEDPTTVVRGLSLDISARMLAVQAIHNWGKDDSSEFFKRHFYRAILQRIFFDLGLVTCRIRRSDVDGNNATPDDTSETKTEAVILGGLPKNAYSSFLNYVRGAAAKLRKQENETSKASTNGAKIATALSSLSNEEILLYEEKYACKKKSLSILWALMAFSAQVFEAAIITDRWLWMKEQREINECWVESVFDYRKSPRNMVVVGVKRDHDH